MKIEMEMSKEKGVEVKRDNNGVHLQSDIQTQMNQDVFQLLSDIWGYVSNNTNNKDVIKS